MYTHCQLFIIRGLTTTFFVKNTDQSKKYAKRWSENVFCSILLIKAKRLISRPSVANHVITSKKNLNYALIKI